MIVLLLSGCTSTKESTIEPIVDFYIQTYQEREDFEGFLNLYAEEMILEDMVAGWRMEGRQQFREFFSWPDERFQKRAENTFEVDDVIISENMAVIKGYFTPFHWDGQEVGVMQFTTLLYFNEEKKIIKHIDWINYPNDLIDYSTRANSNEWID